MKTFLAAPIVPINFYACAVMELCCDWLWYGQLNHIGFYIWSRLILPPSRVSVRPPFLHWASSKDEVPHVLIHPKKAPNTGFVLFTGLVKNSLISPRFWNSMLGRYTIINFRGSFLITTMNRSWCFHNSSKAGTAAKYESAQTILSVLAHGITSSFSNFVPWGTGADNLADQVVA